MMTRKTEGGMMMTENEIGMIDQIDTKIGIVIGTRTVKTVRTDTRIGMIDTRMRDRINIGTGTQSHRQFKFMTTIFPTFLL